MKIPEEVREMVMAEIAVEIGVLKDLMHNKNCTDKDSCPNNHPECKKNLNIYTVLVYESIGCFTFLSSFFTLENIYERDLAMIKNAIVQTAAISDIVKVQRIYHSKKMERRDYRVISKLEESLSKVRGRVKMALGSHLNKLV